MSHGDVSVELTTESEAETEQFGARLATRLHPGDAVFLDGQLGVGKSVIARGIARGLGVPTWRGRSRRR